MITTSKAFIAAQRLLDVVKGAGFNLFNYEDVNAITRYGYEYLPDYLHYEWGATRLVIWDDECDFVIKVAIDAGCEKYNQHEVEVYQAAVADGLADYFGWCDCYIESEYGCPGIYVMEFLEGNEEEVCDNAYKYSYETYCDRNGLDSSDYESMEEYDSIERDEKEEIRTLLESQMSLEEIYEFNKFIDKWHVNDIHAGNVLYHGNVLTICDYAGFGW